MSESIIVKVTNIVWDLDGEPVENFDLPTRAIVEVDDLEDVADALADRFGWCVLDFDVVILAWK